MESRTFSYRLTPVYIAISLALAAPYAQASCANDKDSATCDSNATSQQSSLVIGGQKSVIDNNAVKPAVNLVANKVTIKTTGGESKGVYYYTNDDKADKNTLHITVNPGIERALQPAYSVANPYNISPINHTLANNVTPLILDGGNNSAKTVNNDNHSGAVTIYNSEQNNWGKRSSILLAHSTVANLPDNIYSRLATDESMSLQSSATVIGNYNLSDQGSYVSKPTILYHNNAINNAVMINKRTALKILQESRVDTSSAADLQNLNYIRNQDNDVSITQLFNTFSPLDKPSALKIGYQLKEDIVSGLVNDSSASGMINIRAHHNSIAKRIALRGNFTINKASSYVDNSAYSSDKKLTGNITIYDTNSTKIYVNNTTIYVEGNNIMDAIDIVDNSAGVSPLELRHLTSVNQYKLYNKVPTSNKSNGITLVGFTATSKPLNQTSNNKPKLGA